jgi:HAE1 family hydrophobic/amphiphilic exporter-1
MTERYSSSVLAAALCLAAASNASAQEALSLGDATARALARNHDIRIERLRVDAASADAEQALGEYDLQVRVDIGARRRRTPVTSLFSGAPAGKLGATDTATDASVSLTQLFKTGAVGTLTASSGRASSNSVLTLLSPAYTSSLGVELRQPLLRNRAIDPARLALRVTALDRERSSARFSREVLETVAAVEQAYWTLVSARRELAIRETSVALAERQRADTEVRIEARTIAPSEIAQPEAEIERRRGDLLRAQEAAVRAERALKELMLDDRNDPLWAIAINPVDRLETTDQVDLQTALADGGHLRPEVTELTHQLTESDAQLQFARDTMKPSVDVFARYTADGLGGSRSSYAGSIPGFPTSIPSEIDGGVSDAWSSLANARFSDVAAGVSISIDLGQRTARGQVMRATAVRRERLERLAQLRAHIALEISNAVTAVELAAKRIETARAGVRAAETQLRAEQERFSAGIGSNFMVLTRQSELANAQLAAIASVTDHRKSVVELRRATGTLTRDRGIELAAPSSAPVNR